MSRHRISKVTVEYIDDQSKKPKTLVVEGAGIVTLETSRIPTDQKGKFTENRALMLTMQADSEEVWSGHALPDGAIVCEVEGR